MPTKEKSLTGYPSIDKPWLKYYSEEAINAELPKKTLWQYVYENNNDYPDDIAFRYFGTKITYREFFENVKHTARSFTAMGIAEDDIVTIMSMHTPEAIYAFYGLNYIGAVANMVYMTLSPKEILHTINDTESKLFMVLDPAIPKVKEIQTDLSIPIVILSVSDSMPIHLKMGYRLKNRTKLDGALTYHEFLRKGVGTALPTEVSNSEKMAVIVYTSGTTGEPKGVMLSDNAINNLIFQDMNGLFSFERKLSVLFILPPFLGFGVTHLHMLLCGGLVIILQIQIEPTIVANMFYKCRENVFLAGPAYVDAIMDAKYRHKDLSNLKYFVGGGGEITNKKENEFNDFLQNHHSAAKYSSGYGLTETSTGLSVSCNDISKIGSVGIPFLKTIVKVTDTETNEECGYNKEGELHFSTPAMMLGYFHNSSATDEMIYRDDKGTEWIKTGDLGYVDEDGFIFVTGRIKRIFLSRASDGFAYKLFPQRIEEMLQTDADVVTCGVIVREDVERMNVAIAFVTVKDKLADTDRKEDIKSELFALAEKELPEHEQPAEIHIIDTMPLTPSGKIDYRRLEELQKKSA